MRISYSEIDSAIAQINSIREDGLDEKLTSLNSSFEYSESEVVNKLKEYCGTLYEINDLLNSLIDGSVKVLEVARQVYEDLDTEMSDEME